jgi:hypothetical protein
MACSITAFIGITLWKQVVTAGKHYMPHMMMRYITVASHQLVICLQFSFTIRDHYERFSALLVCELYSEFLIEVVISLKTSIPFMPKFFT